MCSCCWHWTCLEEGHKNYHQHWSEVKEKIIIGHKGHRFLIIDSYTFLHSLAVSVIPEGLIAVTTVTMALAVRRMAAA